VIELTILFIFDKLVILLCTGFIVEGLFKKVAKRKAAALMYEKIRMSEKNSTENKYKDNGVFNNSCVVTSAGFDETLSMATAIDSIGHKTIEANQVQSAGLNNESTENSQRKINCVSITRTTPVDREVKYVPEMNFKGNTIVSDARVFTSAGFHSKPDTIDFVDAPAFTFANEMECVKVNKDSTLKTCNEVFRHPASLEEHDNGLPIVISKFLNHNENYESPLNESIIVNEDKQSLLASVNADLAEQFRLSNNPGVRKLKVITFVLFNHNHRI
jgi:hypothetical protein